MWFYTVLVAFHVISASIWLSLFPVDIVLRGFLNRARGTSGEQKLVSFYLKFANISGIIGMTGILITGIIMVVNMPYYGFFDFSQNHWLASKQVIMVILIAVVFFVMIPKAKQLRTSIGNELDSNFPLTDDAFAKLKSLETIVTVTNVLVLLNFLFAFSRRIAG